MKWVQFAALIFLLGCTVVTVVFVADFILELKDDSRRHKLLQKLKELIKKYKEQKEKNDIIQIEIEILKSEIRDCWNLYYPLWQKFTFKSVSKNFVKGIKSFLESEGII